MPHTIEKLADEPILLVKVEGNFTFEQASKLYEETIAFKEEITERPFFRILDVREMDTDFPNMMHIIRHARNNHNGSLLDEDIQDIFIGRDKMALIARDAFAKDGVRIPVFNDQAAALQAIRSGSL